MPHVPELCTKPYFSCRCHVCTNPEDSAQHTSQFQGILSPSLEGVQAKEVAMEAQRDWVLGPSSCKLLHVAGIQHQQEASLLSTCARHCTPKTSSCCNTMQMLYQASTKGQDDAEPPKSLPFFLNLIQLPQHKMKQTGHALGQNMCRAKTQAVLLANHQTALPCLAHSISEETFACLAQDAGCLLPCWTAKQTGSTL